MLSTNARITFTAAIGLALSSLPAMAQYGHSDPEHANMKAPSAALPSCPVSGEPVNLAVSVPTDDGPVFFCCTHCVSKFKADPTKFADGVHEQREALADRPKIQVTCPVSGDPVDAQAFTEYKGQKVFFCCKNCIPKFTGDPAKYAPDLANSYTYQTKCPVTGEDISPKAFTVLADGNKVYYCCPRCETSLFEKTSTYLPKLVAQGYDFKPGQITRGDSDHPGHMPGHDRGR